MMIRSFIHPIPKWLLRPIWKRTNVYNSPLCQQRVPLQIIVRKDNFKLLSNWHNGRHMTRIIEQRREGKMERKTPKRNGTANIWKQIEETNDRVHENRFERIKNDTEFRAPLFPIKYEKEGKKRCVEPASRMMKMLLDAEQKTPEKEREQKSQHFLHVMIWCLDCFRLNTRALSFAFLLLLTNANQLYCWDKTMRKNIISWKRQQVATCQDNTHGAAPSKFLLIFRCCCCWWATFEPCNLLS